MQNPHPKVLQQAISHLITTHPFYAAILLRQTIVEDNSKPTFSVNGKVLKYNRGFCESLKFDTLVGVLAHEVLHLTLRHHARMKGRDNSVWNQACDYVINPMVLESGFKLPDGVLSDAEFTGKPAEEVYRTLMSRKADEQAKQDAQDQQEKEDKAKESEKSDDSAEDAQDSEDSEDQQDEEDSDSQEDGEGESNKGDSDSSDSQDGEGQGNGESEDNEGSESDGESESGNGSGGGQESGEPGQDEPASFGEIEPAEESNAEEISEIQVAQALAQAKSCGKVPAFLERAIGEVLPRVDWREALARFVRERVKTDHSFRTPNKRFVQRGFILPSLDSETIGNVVFACDTSGSISEAEVNKFANELLSALQVFEEVGKPSELTAIYCDSQVQHVETLTSGDKPSPKGGGGTDFRPPFDYIEREGIEPIAVVYMTDGYCSSFPSDPGYPVLWAVIGSYYAFTPPFGEVLLMDINT